MEIKGFVNINKPTGLTSSDVVIRVRNQVTRYSGEKIKAGHLGTLDPGGAGVLPVALGKATRLFDYFLKKDKVYRADFVFGIATDTVDSYGSIVGRGRTPSLGEILAVLPRFIGRITQVPPMYSAISVDGRRLYDLAREGKSVEVPSREIDIYSIDYVGSKSSNMHTFDIHASSGTYIRTLVSDIAKALGTVGYMASIIRLRSGGFKIENSVTFEEFMDDVPRFITPIDSIISSDPYIEVDKIYTRHILSGIKLDTKRLLGGITDTNIEYSNKDDLENYVKNNDFIVKIEGEIIGIGELDNRGLLNIPSRLV